MLQLYQVDTIQISKRATEDESKIIKAYHSDLVKDFIKENFAELNQFVISEIGKAKYISGSKVVDLSENEIRIVADEIIETIKDHPWIKVNELPLIFKWGLRQRLGETYGFNAASVDQWIKNYQYGVRAKAMKEKIRYDQELQKQEEAKRDAEKMKESDARCKKRIQDIISKCAGADCWQDIPKDILYNGVLLVYLQRWNYGVKDDLKNEIYQRHFKALYKDPDLLGKPKYVRQMKAKQLAKDEEFRRVMYQIIKTKK